MITPNERAVAAVGLLEPITHKEEIESLLNEAQSMYDNAKNKFESQKKQTTKRGFATKREASEWKTAEKLKRNFNLDMIFFKIL